MEKITVFYSKSVQDYFDELIEILFEDDYFIYEENAINYVQKLVAFINKNIQSFPHRKTPQSLSKYGDFYIFYNSNARTTWFIFFAVKENVYLIKHITNNHSFDSKLVNET